MKYDISKQTAPTMPKLGKGTECIKILLSQASKDIKDAFFWGVTPCFPKPWEFSTEPPHVHK